MWRQVAQRVHRIGVEIFWRHDDGRHAVTLRNRTYAQRFDIPPANINRWREAFGLENVRLDEEAPR